MSKSEMATRSAYRTLKFSFSKPRRVTTYVKPPRMRASMIGVRQALRGLAAIAAFQFASPAALALPTDGVVVSGTATITLPNGTTMQINQSTPKAILNWLGFSIANGEIVNFIQPSSSSVALNRVTGASASEIFGALNANGKVFLVNPNGILFAPGASVNVGGLVASTLDITNENFQAGGTPGNPYVFTNGVSAA